MITIGCIRGYKSYFFVSAFLLMTESHDSPSKRSAEDFISRGWDDGRRRRLLNAISTSFHHPQIDGLRENVILCIGSHVKRLRPDLDLTPREVLSKPFFDWGQTATDILAEALKMVIDSSTMTASTPTHPKQSPYPQTTPSYPTLHRYWSHSRP